MDNEREQRPGWLVGRAIEDVVERGDERRGVEFATGGVILFDRIRRGEFRGGGWIERHQTLILLTERVGSSGDGRSKRDRGDGKAFQENRCDWVAAKAREPQRAEALVAGGGGVSENLDTAAVTEHAAVFGPIVFTTFASIVARWTKSAGIVERGDVGDGAVGPEVDVDVRGGGEIPINHEEPRGNG